MLYGDSVGSTVDVEVTIEPERFLDTGELRRPH